MILLFNSWVCGLCIGVGIMELAMEKYWIALTQLVLAFLNGYFVYSGIRRIHREAIQEALDA